MVVDPDLREWDYGALEGRLTADIREDYPGWSIWTGPWPERRDRRRRSARGPTGCSPGSAPRTATSWSSRTAISCGSWPLAGSTCRPRQAALFALGTATVSILGWERENPVIETWNEACHLA